MNAQQIGDVRDRIRWHRAEAELCDHAGAHRLADGHRTRALELDLRRRYEELRNDPAVRTALAPMLEVARRIGEERTLTIDEAAERLRDTLRTLTS